jgi:hypothetical protein
MTHRYVIISGVPGAGKSHVGRALSTHPGWPLLSKDVIKEALADSLGLGAAESLSALIFTAAAGRGESPTRPHVRPPGNLTRHAGKV